MMAMTMMMVVVMAIIMIKIVMAIESGGWMTLTGMCQKIGQRGMDIGGVNDNDDTWSY